MLDGILFEKAGLPAVSIVTAPFRITGVTMAGNWGVPDYRFLEIPHPIANLNDDELDDRVDGVIEAVISLWLNGQE